MGTPRRPNLRWAPGLLVRMLLAGILAAGLAGALAPAASWADPTPAPAPTAPKPTPTPTPTPNPGTPTPNPTPDPTPNPSPGQQPTPQPDTSDDDDPAWYDIPGQVRKAIREFFADLVKDNINSVMQTLGETVLSTPDLAADERVKTLWTTSLVTTNAVFVLFIVAGGFVVASRETLQTRHGLKQVLPRLAVAAVASNTSLLLCGKLLWATNALTAAIAGQGVDAKTAGDAIAQNINSAQLGTNFLLSLLALAVIVTVLVVAITFIMRVACMVLLIGFAPLALVCHALPQTEGLAYTWWRAMGACLGIQLAQAAIVLGAIRIFFTPTGSTILGIPSSTDGYMKILICLCMLWILIKIPGWMKQFVLGSIGQRHGRGLLGQLLHTYLTIKTLGTATGLLKGAKAARAAKAGTGTRAAKTGTKPGTRTAPRRALRPAAPNLPRRGSTPATAGTGRPRGSAGPAAFSHAPTTQQPLPAPTGTAGAPSFSHTPGTAISPRPTGPVPPARFSSHAAGTDPALPAPAGTAGPVTFSHASVQTPVTSNRPPAAVSFSNVPATQTAPRRPPAPVTPAFSAAPRSGSAGTESSRPSRRPTAAVPTAGTTSPVRVPAVPAPRAPVPPATSSRASAVPAVPTRSPATLGRRPASSPTVPAAAPSARRRSGSEG